MALTSQDLIFGYRFNKINFNVPGNVFPNNQNIGGNSFRIGSNDAQEMIINWGDSTFQTYNFGSGYSLFFANNNYHIFPKNVTLSGTDGTGNISFGTDNFLVTFATNLTTTASNFVTEHEADLQLLNIKVTANAEVLTFTFEGTNQDLPVFTNLTDSLGATIDDTQTDYNISFTFEKPELINDIVTLNVDLGNVFPENITKLRNITDISIRISIGGSFGLQTFPSDLSALEKLKSLTVEEAELDEIDESILSLTSLETLKLSGSLDLNNSAGNFEATNFNKLNQLQNTLKILAFINCNITEFPSNFIELNIEELIIGGTNPYTTLSANLPTSIKILDFERKVGKITSWTNFDRLENLERLNFRGENIDLTIPIGSELAECTRLKTVSQKQLNDTSRDTFISICYDFVTTYANLNPTDVSIEQNKFRDMLFSMTIEISDLTGTYEAPTGFIQGSNNGTPTTPEERIYVLVENYGHTWEVGSQTYEQI